MTQNTVTKTCARKIVPVSKLRVTTARDLDGGAAARSLGPPPLQVTRQVSDVGPPVIA